jgi:hypothetical protein
MTYMHTSTFVTSIVVPSQDHANGFSISSNDGSTSGMDGQQMFLNFRDILEMTPSKVRFHSPKPGSHKGSNQVSAEDVG